MILDYTSTHGLRLVEPDDFKRFKLRLADKRLRPEIAGVSFADDDNALIDAALAPTLPGAPQNENWRRQYLAMVEYAASKGWLVNGAIRAHVERIPLP